MSAFSWRCRCLLTLKCQLALRRVVHFLSGMPLKLVKGVNNSIFTSWGVSEEDLHCKQLLEHGARAHNMTFEHVLGAAAIRGERMDNFETYRLKGAQIEWNQWSTHRKEENRLLLAKYHTRRAPFRGWKLGHSGRFVAYPKATAVTWNSTQQHTNREMPGNNDRTKNAWK